MSRIWEESMSTGTVMTIDEVAEYLRISRGLAYRQARAGSLPGVLRIGNRYVVSKVALDRALGVEIDEVADVVPLAEAADG
jgi:excisionase family DNA binding protein